MITPVSDLIDQVSDLFKVDVEALAEYFENVGSTAEHIKQNMSHFSSWIHELATEVRELSTISMMIERKLVNFRYHDRTAWHYFTKIENNYVLYINDIIQKMKEEYQRAGPYNLDPSFIQRYLDEIIIKAQEAIKLIRKAIKDRAFE